MIVVILITNTQLNKWKTRSALWRTRKSTLHVGTDLR